MDTRVLTYIAARIAICERDAHASCRLGLFDMAREERGRAEELRGVLDAAGLRPDEIDDHVRAEAFLFEALLTFGYLHLEAKAAA